MKQLILGITIGVAAGLLLGGTAVYAGYVETPWTKNIYNVSDVEEINGSSVGHTVSVFDDGDNKCYVVNAKYVSGRSPAISCVKRGDR